MRRVSGFARAIGRYASAMLDAEPQRSVSASRKSTSPGKRNHHLEQLVGSLCFRVEHAGSTALPPDGASGAVRCSQESAPVQVVSASRIRLQALKPDF